MGKPSRNRAKKAAKSNAMNARPDPAPPTQQLKTAVWQPGVDHMEEGHELDYDPTAYSCFLGFSIDWPCLSFDVLRDNLAAKREEYPHTMYLAAGTQAALPKDNCVVLMKVTGIGQGRHGPVSTKPGTTNTGEDASDDEDSDSSDSDVEGEKDAESLHTRSIPHFGGVNRIRAMPQQPSVIAAFGDTAIVQVWDMGRQLEELLPLTGQSIQEQKGHVTPAPLAPRHMHRHAQEGYALDWSPVSQGRLASGDCASAIQVAEPSEAGRWQVGAPYQGHKGSVEDIQWSPAEPTVFASSSVDRSIRIWDTRDRSKAQLAVENCHGSDVNVISWRSVVSHMLASGGDEGVLKVWDLRFFASGKHLANLSHHRGPITSVEWSPFEGAMLSTGSEDGTVGLWDLSVERDPEEEAALGQAGASAPADLPPQLLFIHAGQNNIKEVHWHLQIPGMVLSTAQEGFNAFKAANV